VEPQAKERDVTPTAFLTRATDFFGSHGITIERVLTDNVRATGPRPQRLLGLPVCPTTAWIRMKQRCTEMVAQMGPC
jgi:hypothetical protein